MERVSKGSAFYKCVHKALITLDGLAKGECIHYYDGKFWYEDGSMIAEGSAALADFFNKWSWSRDAQWYVLKTMSKEQYQRLVNAHKSCLINRGENIKVVINSILEG